jgi:hypothetical protein
VKTVSGHSEDLCIRLKEEELSIPAYKRHNEEGELGQREMITGKLFYSVLKRTTSSFHL